MKKTIYNRFFKEVSEALDTISWGLVRSHPIVSRVNVLSLLILFTVLTIIGAYSQSYIVKGVVMLFSIALLTAVKNRKHLVNAIKTYTYTAILALLLGIPSVFLYRAQDVALSILNTVLSILAASSPMMVFIVIVGLRKIFELFEYISYSLKTMLMIFIALLPKMSKMMSEILLARSSRNIGATTSRDVWRILISITGDSLIYVNNISNSIALALTARDVESYREKNMKFNIVDITVIFISILIAALALWRWSV